MNIPYVKSFDENGKVSNPIIGIYKNEFLNRRKRREEIQKKRFVGNSKNHHLSIFKNMKYQRICQVEFDKKGNKKIIEHYIVS